jgi:hypothetical protein
VIRERSPYLAHPHPKLVRQLVELGFESWIELEFRSCNTGFQLFGLARTDDRGGDGRVGEHPRNGKSGEFRAGFFRQFAERLEHSEFALVPIAIVYIFPAVPSVNRLPSGVRRRLVLASEQPPQAGCKE